MIGVLAQVEPEPRLQADAVVGVEPAEHIPEHAVVGGDVVLAGVRDLERIGQVREADRFAGGEVSPDVVDRDDRLLHDVLADDVVFTQGVVVQAAVVLLARQRDVLADTDAVQAERRVDAHGPPLQPGIGGGAVLIEVVERHVVRVILPAARHREVRVTELTGPEHRLPPVRPGAARHDERVGELVRTRVHVGAGSRHLLRPAGVRPDVGRHRRVVSQRIVSVDVRRDVEPGIAVGRFHYLEIVERVQLEDVVHPADRRGHTGFHVQRNLAPARLAALGLDHDHAVARARAVDRHRRGVLQDVDGRDLVRVQPVQVGVLNGRPVHHVERIVVLKRGDAADPHRGARPGRATVIDGHAGHAPIEPLQHAGRGLPLHALGLDAGGGAGEVLAQLRLVSGDDHVRQHRDRRLEGHVDARPPGDALRVAAVPDQAEHQDGIRRDRDRILPLRVRHRAGVAPPHADGDPGNGPSSHGGRHRAGHLDRLLGKRWHAHQERQRNSHPHCTKKTRTLEHVVHWRDPHPAGLRMAWRPCFVISSRYVMRWTL